MIDCYAIDGPAERKNWAEAIGDMGGIGVDHEIRAGTAMAMAKNAAKPTAEIAFRNDMILVCSDNSRPDAVP